MALAQEPSHAFLAALLLRVSLVALVIVVYGQCYLQAASPATLDSALSALGLIHPLVITRIKAEFFLNAPVMRPLLLLALNRAFTAIAILLALSESFLRKRVLATSARPTISH